MDTELELAKAIIEKYDNEDDYIMAFLKHYDMGGEVDDNSIHLSKYYRKCQELVKEDLLNKC